MRRANAVAFTDMLGATLASVTGCVRGSDKITFTATDGRVWVLQHEQDCCESVQVEDVTGTVSDLLGSPLTMAEMVVGGTPEGYVWPSAEPESCTWVFYKLATVRGYVTLRWLGESNGYYGEEAVFRCVRDGVAA